MNGFAAMEKSMEKFVRSKLWLSCECLLRKWKVYDMKISAEPGEFRWEFKCCHLAYCRVQQFRTRDELSGNLSQGNGD